MLKSGLDIQADSSRESSCPKKYRAPHETNNLLLQSRDFEALLKTVDDASILELKLFGMKENCCAMILHNHLQKKSPSNLQTG